MTAFPVGARSYVVVRYRMLLFEDRVEEVGGTLLGLDIRRLFFDEVQCATVHRTGAALEILAGAFCALLFVAGSVLSFLGDLPIPGVILGVLTLVGVWYAIRAGVWPPYVLVLRTGDQALETRLPREPARRAEVVGRLARTIERYQLGQAPVATAPPPSGEAPPAPPGVIAAPE